MRTLIATLLFAASWTVAGFEMGRFFTPRPQGQVTCGLVGVSVDNVTFTTRAYQAGNADDLADLSRALEQAVCHREVLHQ